MYEHEDHSVELDRIRKSARATISRLELDRNWAVDVFYDAMQNIVLAMEANLLAEDDAQHGQQTVSVTANAQVEQTLKPRWFPGFLWRRLKTKTVAASRTAQQTFKPRWSYPKSRMKLPDSLGQPVRFLVKEPVNYRVR